MRDINDRAAPETMLVRLVCDRDHQSAEVVANQ